MESVHRRALRLLGKYVLVFRLTARGDVDIWVILIKKIHICDSIGDVHDSITCCLLVDPLAHPSLLWSTSTGDLLLLWAFGRNTQTTVMTISRPRRPGWGCITISLSRLTPSVQK